MVHSDNSFGTNTKEFFDFQVSLTTNRSLILSFDTYTKKCVSCEGYLFFNKKTKYKTIDFYKYADGNLKIELSDFEKNNLLCDYEIKEQVVYDAEKTRICIGDMNNNEVIKFGCGQYALVQDDRLTGIVLDLNV